MQEIHIYTDGSALGNPGPGGYGIIIEWVGKGYIKEFSRGFKYTTNNRMELWAVIDALERLKKKPMDVLIISDSKYVIEAIEKKWVFGWQKKNFKGKKNPDLWRRFLKIYPQHNVQFQWVKGHNNHPQNERCDLLALTAAKDMAIEQDTYYEQLTQKA
jgi:ribonuclease HI